MIVASKPPVASSVREQTSDAPPFRVASARWGLLLIFLAGYLACNRTIGPLDRSFLPFTLLNTAALALLLSRLGDPLRRTLWAWAVLLVLLTGVFAKMFWFTARINDAGYVNRTFVGLRWVNRERILEAYPWVTLGFVTFCVATWAALTWSRSLRPRRRRQVARESAGVSLHLVVVSFLLYLVLSLVQVSLGYGVLGLANPTIPGRLGTVLTLLRQQIIPAALLLSMWVLDRQKPQWAKIPMLLIVLAGVTDALVTTSRGALPATAAPILLLWVLTGRVTRQRKMAIIAIGLTALILFPVVSADRQRRRSQTPGERALPSAQAIVDAAFFMLIRPTGVEGIWHGYDHRGAFSPQRIVRFLRPRVMTNHYTRTVVRVRAANDNRAPGLIGALMIMGGSGAVVVMMVATTFLLQWMWTLLYRLESWPVALALAGPAIAVFVSGGLEWLFLAKFALQALACEVLYRKLLRRQDGSQRNLDAAMASSGHFARFRLAPPYQPR